RHAPGNEDPSPGQPPEGEGRPIHHGGGHFYCSAGPVKIPRLGLLIAAALVLSACRHKEITKLEREEAANVASEADFAVTVREWSRAEGLYAKAATLCPDSGDYWVSLGIVRMRLNDHSGARSAY